MPVQFSPDTQQGDADPAGPADPASPEQVRKKWDALLGVINNVASDSIDNLGQGSDASKRPPLRDARELLSESAGARTLSHGRRREWNDRHHLLYSTVNDKMQKNIRSYFGRTREIESYGMRYDEPLRTTWQIDTPEEKPALGTMKGHFAKFNQTPSGSRQGLLPAIPDSPGAQSSMEGSPQSTGMSRVQSEPSYHKRREAKWDARHSVVFQKDNHHYHANLRAYFERPRAVLW